MTGERKTFARNLVGFVCTKPPWVVFTIFLGMFALGFFALGYYVQHSSIVDAEASKGWNSLYSNLSSLAFCLNASESIEASGKYREFSQDFETVNISLPFLLTVRPHPWSLPLNTSDLVGILPSSHFKFGKNFYQESQFWISLDSSYLFGHCVYDEEDSGKCRETTYPTCVTISMPSAVVPLMRPRTCNYTSRPSILATVSVVGKKPLDDVETPICGTQIELSLAKERIYDSEVALSFAEKTHLNLKLQLASYFLFVLFLSFILFAAIKGKRIKRSKKKRRPKTKRRQEKFK